MAPFSRTSSTRWTRREFIRTAGAAAAAGVLPSRSGAEDMNRVTVSIYHTTDLHGHILPTENYQGRGDLGGLARCATQIRAWQKENPNALLLDVGDVYQGTQVGLGTRGKVMIRCFNALNYDAWVVGNHEFDWGMDPFRQALTDSHMPVLSANSRIDGKAAEMSEDAADPFSRLKPYFIKEVAGFRIAVIGVTTSGLPYWLPPECLPGYEVFSPVEAVRQTLVLLQAESVDAILLAGHMGVRAEGDDFANQVAALTREFPKITVFLGGHTHRNIPSQEINGVLYTQADYFGIHVGRVDLVFDRALRQVVERRAQTVLMDNQTALDPQILALAQPDLDASAVITDRPVGEVTEPFSIQSSFGTPSDVERLFASAILEALRKSGVAVDMVVHGLFDHAHDIAVGPKTVADLWKLIPFENTIVTADFTRETLLQLANELGRTSEVKNLMPCQLRLRARGVDNPVREVLQINGDPLFKGQTYRVAINSYDAQSAGQHLPGLPALLADPLVQRKMTTIQTRQALIDFFEARQKISPQALLV